MPRGRPFLPGQSGNPSGRPKDKGLAEYIRQKTQGGKALVEFWLSVLDSDDPKLTWDHKLKAADALADRGFGKPVQQTVNEHTSDQDAPMRIVVEYASGNSKTHTTT
jgi:hypothetical protein